MKQQKSLIFRYVPVLAILILIFFMWFLSSTESTSHPVGGVDFSQLRKADEQRRLEKHNNHDNKLGKHDHNSEHHDHDDDHHDEHHHDHDDKSAKKSAAAVNDEVNKNNNKNPHVKLITAIGSITFELLPQAAPNTVNNFIKLVKSGFFSKQDTAPSASFYRAEMNDNNPRYDFCLQGGGWPVKSSPFGKIKHEYNKNFPNKKYAVSMARTADPDSATSEFSIMLADNSKWLGPGGSEPYGYAVFAQVVDGFEFIEKFRKMPKKKTGGLTYLKERVEFIDAKIL